MRPALTHDYFYGPLTNEKFQPDSFELPSYNALMFSFSSNLIKNIEAKNFIINCTPNFIKMGILIDDEEYLKEYNAYWKK